jgi:hypothetical protein
MERNPPAWAHAKRAPGRQGVIVSSAALAGTLCSEGDCYIVRAEGTKKLEIQEKLLECEYWLRAGLGTLEALS